MVVAIQYIAYTSRSIASGPKYLTGARHFLRDIYPDFDKNRASAFVQTTIRGSVKLRADPVRRKDPLRIHHLILFHNIASESKSYDDMLFATILSLAFFACHLIGELVIPNDKSLFDWRKIIKRSSIIHSNRRIQYTLPYHKGDPYSSLSWRAHHIHLIETGNAGLVKAILVREISRGRSNRGFQG